jgi:uncharacterized protein
MSRRLVTLASAAALVMTVVPWVTGAEVRAIGPVSLTTLDTPHTQNFDSLPASGFPTWTNNSTIPGWFHARTGSGSTIVANDGSSNAGNLYSYGTGTATDRALGSVGSGNAAVGNLFWGVRLSNETGSTITSLDVSYIGEQWRNSLAAAQTVSFSYVIGTPSVSGSLTEFQAGVGVPQLDFTSPITGGTTAGALDGNLAANRLAINFTVTGLNVPAGSEIMLQWSDPDHSGADHGLAIDDLSVTPHTGELPPEPDLCADPITRIHTLQGSGPGTPAPGTYATRGIVVGDFETGAGAQGFYIQEPDPDGDPLTSEGIFVFTGSANVVSVGDAVGVSGFVRERFNQTAIQGANSNTSAVPASNIAICSTGNPLPPATPVTLPYDPATLLEPYEGMRVVFPQSLVISEYFNYDQFGEIVLAQPLPGETRPFTGTAIDEPGAEANARAAANARSRITLDDARGGSNPTVLRHPNGEPFSLANMFRGGDLVTDAIGVLGYDFNLYRIYPTAPAEYTQINPRPAAPEPVGGTIQVAAMNTLNYFLTLDRPTGDPLDNKCGPSQNVECRGADFDQPTEFSRQRTKLLAALAGLNADVIGLNELENTPGVDPAGDIVAGLNDILGPGTYAAIDTGVIGTDAIKVGLIYKTAAVTAVGAFETLTSADDPRFIDTRSRPTLAQTFAENSTGERFTVAVNHLKSKGSSCADIGDPDALDGQANCNGTRTSAAQALVDWLGTDPTGSGDPDFLIMGDLNSYAQEDPIDAVKLGPDDAAGTGDDYVNLIAEYQGAYAYSYTFDGQAGYLDHALANTKMAAQVTGAADWHINSDEPDAVDYDTTFKPPAQEALYEPNGNRSSDHDPVVVGLNLDSDTPPTAAVTGGQCSNSNVATAQFAVTLADPDSATLEFELVSSSDTSLVPTGNVVVTGDGSNRTVTVSAAPKHSGVATLTFAVSDATSTVNLVVTVQVGTDGDETLTGTAGSDVMLGLGGRDVLDVLAGNDVICGASGDDTLSGGDGNDVVDGAKGSDTLTGGSGDDQLHGGAGDDSLTGDAGADSFSGGSGADSDTDFDAGAGDTSDGT